MQEYWVMKLPFLLQVTILAVTALPAVAEEGMWLVNRFPKEDVKKKYGITVTDDFLSHLQTASVRFNSGGSGSFVSADGLVFTNHHVGADCIFKVSSKENDYMKKGFHARTREAEKACPDLELNVLLRIDTVTDKVKEGITDATAPADAVKIRRANTAKIESECNKATGNRCDVVSLYSGGQYDLYQYKKYTDIRLVFAPEEAIAAFGGDPDNFTFPRYCLDFALFRAYENGKPVKVEHYLKWSKTGAKDGQLVFVSGNPGRTERMATVAELELQRDVTQPYQLDILKKLADRLLAFGAESEENKRIARDLLASVQNSYKARSGFQRGLEDPELMRIKQDQEIRLRKAIDDDPAKRKQFAKIWDEIAAYTDEYRKFYVASSLLERAPATGSDLYSKARMIVRYTAEKAKPNTERFREYQDAVLPQVEMSMFSEAPIYPALEEVVLEQWFLRLTERLGAADETVKKLLRGQTPKEAARYYVRGTKLMDVAERRKLAGNAAAVAASTDTMIELARTLDPIGRGYKKMYEDKVESVVTTSAARIAQARFAVYGDKDYPDATFTFRITYAPVKGYVNGKGETVNWATNFDGLYGRATGKEPFALPESWLKARKSLRLRTPYNFVSTADTHGGNSGSPTVNAKGEIVGILFDGNIEGLPNQYVYRDKMERSVHVASQGIAEALRTVYGARELLKELGL